MIIGLDDEVLVDWVFEVGAIDYVIKFIYWVVLW